jgi:hypothetical protein
MEDHWIYQREMELSEKAAWKVLKHDGWKI